MGRMDIGQAYTLDHVARGPARHVMSARLQLEPTSGLERDRGVHAGRSQGSSSGPNKASREAGVGQVRGPEACS